MNANNNGKVRLYIAPQEKKEMSGNLYRQCSLILSNHVAHIRDYNVDILVEVLEHKDRIECTLTEVNKPHTREIELYSFFDTDNLLREIRNFAVRHTKLTVWQRNVYDCLTS